MYGYVYVRETVYRELNKVVKIGITENLSNREVTYITGEYIRGKYILAYEVLKTDLHLIDEILEIELIEYNRIDKSCGGIEYYDESVLEIIDSVMISIGKYHRKLTEEEIRDIRKKSQTKINENIKRRKEIIEKKLQKVLPRDYQEEIIQKSINYFEDQNKGLLVLMCGMGKTLISLWICKRLSCDKILIGVPNKLLLDQWKEQVQKLFPEILVLTIKSGISQDNIEKFSKNSKFVIITTYHSSYKLEKFDFDMKIYDEVHHLTTEDIETAKERNSFVRILNIRSRKQIGLTATMKELENFEKSVSNDDTSIFGNIVDEKNLLWAIERNITTDYLIQTVQIKGQIISNLGNIRTNNETNLMLAAYCAVQSIKYQNSNHMLIYCNSTENSIKVIEYIQRLEKSIFSSPYHSCMSIDEQKKVLTQLTNSQKGIISCVYCLGEGWDFPQLDSVLFAERMTSNIRIVQSALRACRKNKKVPEKIAKIILPVLYRENWLDDNTNDDLRKVREVIYQMSLEDERIMQKIVFSELNPSDFEEGNGGTKSFGSINEDITSQLILKTVPRNQLGITYEKAKQIIREEKKRVTVESQKEYLELCKSNTKLNEDPQNHFGDRFIDWVDYLSIEDKYYDLETAKTKIQQYLEEHFDASFGYIILAQKIYELDKNFPPVDLWTSYYKINDIDCLFLDNSIPDSIF